MNTITNQSSNPSSSKKGTVDVASATKRLSNELMSLMMSGIKGVSAFPEADNMFSWIATIDGPEGTPYQDLIYKLSMKFSTQYPYNAPTVTFLTSCFHPNVDIKSGHICLDILKEKWSAVYNVQSILLSIQSLLGEPNNNSPLNPQASNLWESTVEFRAKVLELHPGNEN